MSPPPLDRVARIEKIATIQDKKRVAFVGFSSWYEIPPQLDTLFSAAAVDGRPLLVMFTRDGIQAARKISRRAARARGWF